MPSNRNEITQDWTVWPSCVCVCLQLTDPNKRDQNKSAKKPATFHELYYILLLYLTIGPSACNNTWSRTIFVLWYSAVNVNTPFYNLTHFKYNAHICMVMVFTCILHGRTNWMDSFFFYSASHPFVSLLPITQWLKHISKQTNLCICHSWLKPPCLPLQCEIPASLSHVSTFSEIITEKTEKSHRN